MALHGRDTSALQKVRSEIEAAGGKAMEVVADVTQFSEIETAVGTIEKSLGPIDVVVANAAGGKAMPGPLEEMSEADWHSTIDGTLTATFLTIKAVLPSMKKRMQGNIITISSAAGRRPHPQSPIAYASAKAGIQMLTQHLAAQVGPFGVRVNCIAPETILTENNRRRIPQEMQARLADAHPIQRLGMPEDIANAALFLASDAASWVTGTILDIDGGGIYFSPRKS